MILRCRDEQGPIELVRQIDHARMAARIAAAWRKPEGMPEPAWEKLLEAVEHHDDGWEQADRRIELDTEGQPVDFNHLPAARHIEIWRMSVRLGHEHHPWVDLLTSLHARWLYTKHSREDDDKSKALVQEWIDELTGHVDQALRRCRAEGRDFELATEPRMLSQAQRLVSLFDALSLMLLGAIEVQESTAAIAYGKQSAPLRIIDLKRKMTFWPWPFTRAKVKVTVPYRSLNPCDSGDPTRTWELMAAPPAGELTWTLQPE
ncbi:MAG: DUF3891 family protein [Phycisphaeraceae bacterium]|nr:DUF3891 family protein [Phycisphaeraceae bacterium]